MTAAQLLRRHWPVTLIILVCTVMHLVKVSPWMTEETIRAIFLLIPRDVVDAWEHLRAGEIDDEVARVLFTTVTYSLFHGDSLHIALNMIFIWMFASLVFREMGAAWVFVIYLFTTITGALGQIILDPQSPIPMLGASGALLGFEGVYFLLAIRWRLPDPDVWPIAEPIPPERLLIFAAIGLVLDLSGIVGQVEGIAFGAHIGGFIGGALIGSIVSRRWCRDS